MGELVVHRARVANWVREVAFVRGQGVQGGRDVRIRFRPLEDLHAESELVFDARLASFDEAVTTVAAFLNLPFDRWPGPGRDGEPEPGAPADERFLDALKRNAIALPDASVFSLTSGWLVSGRDVTHWAHAHIPFPTRYPYRGGQKS